MLKRSSIARKSKGQETECWLCNEPKLCHHYDNSVSGYLCENCWQDALDIDALLANPDFGLRHPKPNEFPKNKRY